MSQSISSTTFEQAGRWLEMLANAQDSGHWSKFEQKYRAFLGFVRAVANDPAAVEAVSMMIGDVETDPQGIASLKAIDAAVFGLPLSEESISALFIPENKTLLSCVAKLVSYVRYAPTTMVTSYGESGTVIDRSLALRHSFDRLVNGSTDYARPTVECLIVYVYGTLFANTDADTYDQFLGNPNHVPFHFELLLKTAEAVFNALKVRQVKSPSQVTRSKSEKFGVLDSPALLDDDLENANGILGSACIYLDIDNFKTLNTKFSERVVDRDLLTDYQRLLATTAETIGFAYAEGGDETVVLLPNASLAMAVSFSESFRSALDSRIFILDTEKVQITVSIGIAHGVQSSDLEMLPERANVAMRKAKEMGKNRVFSFSESGSKEIRLLFVT